MWTVMWMTLLGAVAVAPLAMAARKLATGPRGQIGSVVLDDMTRNACKRRNHPLHEQWEMACRAVATSGITVGKNRL